MNNGFDIRLKAFVVVAAIGMSAILMAEFAHMAFNQGIKRIAMAEKSRKSIGYKRPAIFHISLNK